MLSSKRYIYANVQFRCAVQQQTLVFGVRDREERIILTKAISTPIFIFTGNSQDTIIISLRVLT